MSPLTMKISRPRSGAWAVGAPPLDVEQIFQRTLADSLRTRGPATFLHPGLCPDRAYGPHFTAIPALHHGLFAPASPPYHAREATPPCNKNYALAKKNGGAGSSTDPAAWSAVLGEPVVYVNPLRPAGVQLLLEGGDYYLVQKVKGPGTNAGSTTAAELPVQVPWFSYRDQLEKNPRTEGQIIVSGRIPADIYRSFQQLIHRVDVPMAYAMRLLIAREHAEMTNNPTPSKESTLLQHWRSINNRGGTAICYVRLPKNEATSFASLVQSLHISKARCLALLMARALSEIRTG